MEIHLTTTHTNPHNYNSLDKPSIHNPIRSARLNNPYPKKPNNSSPNNTDKSNMSDNFKPNTLNHSLLFIFT